MIIRSDQDLIEYAESVMTCYDCHGSGKNKTGARKCRACNGKGKVISDLGIIARAIEGFAERNRREEP